jgi:hypothetical protein
MDATSLKHASQFRQLLTDGRKKYASGRSFDAVEKFEKALALGTTNLPRFNENSLVKAHALVELGLACSAVCTDFRGESDKLQAHQEQTKRHFDEAMEIFLARLSDRTLTVFRREEFWITNDDYDTPVAHSERLGPMDFLSCVQLALSLETPSPNTVHKFKRALQFAKDFKARGYQLDTEAGPSLASQPFPRVVMAKLEETLAEHEQCVLGGDAPTRNRPPGHASSVGPEFRHAGTRSGDMVDTNALRAADVEERGLQTCAYEQCKEQEQHPRQFKTCSACKWAAYCCRDHQKAHWKAHKKECATSANQARAQHKQARQAIRDVLLPGQMQQFFTVVHYLHPFCVNSAEMKQVQRRIPDLRLPKVSNPQESMMLSNSDRGLIWHTLLVNMSACERAPMLHRFVQEMQASGAYPPEQAGGPPFSVSLAWSAHHVSGTFAVVEHTPSGSIFLYETEDGSLCAYRAVGLSDPIPKLLAERPLPLLLQTTLLPFKDIIIYNGVVVGLDPRHAPHLMASALSYASTPAAARQAPVEQLGTACDPVMVD